MCDQLALWVIAQPCPATATVSEGRFRVMFEVPEAHENLLEAKLHLEGPTSTPNLGGLVVLIIDEAACAGNTAPKSGAKAARRRRTATRKGSSCLPSQIVTVAVNCSLSPLLFKVAVGERFDSSTSPVVAFVPPAARLCDWRQAVAKVIAPVVPYVQVWVRV